MITSCRILAVLIAAFALGFGAAACGTETTKDAGIPNYKPSDVVSEESGSTVLTSPDPVEKVARFYVDFANTKNWDTVSKSVSGNSANLTIKKSGQGATVAIVSRPSGALITISTYKAP